MSKLNILKGVKNASYLAIANVISEILQFASMIYVVKELGPTDYGFWVTVTAFTGFFGVFTFTGFNKVLIREGSKNPSKMSNSLEDVVGIRNFFGLISVLLCVLCLFFTPYDSEVKLYISLYCSI